MKTSMTNNFSDKIPAANDESVMLNVLLSNSDIGICLFEIGEKLKALYLNPGYYSLSGYTPEDIKRNGDDMTPVIHHAELERVRTAFNKSIENGTNVKLELRTLKKDGKTSWHDIRAARIPYEQSSFPVYVATITDITAHKKIEETLRFRAEYDELTEIYNSSAFYTKTKMMFAHDRKTTYVMGRFDVVNFKIVNDLYGHAEGDRLIRYVAKWLSGYLGSNSTYGRMECDNFAFCMPYTQEAVESLIHDSTEHMESYGLDYDISLCFGLYIIRDKQLPIDIMLDRATLAQKSIKGNYVKKYAYFKESMRSSILHEMEITSQFTSALEQEQFEIYLQPQYNHFNSSIVGAEALVRWNHPMLGFIPPNEFIPILEKSGFITMLDEYVWEHVCALMRKWYDSGASIVPVSVNISRLDIYNPKLCEVLKELIKKYRLPVSMLKLEITESAYVENPEQLINVVKELQSLGFTIQMDDFGSGYSSLNTLKDVPVDALKLDLKFLADDVNGRGGNILNSIVRMAKWLGLSVIAEGVETHEQSEYLKSIGCEIVQGYLYSRPLPVIGFEALVKSFESTSAEYSLSDSNEFWSTAAQESLIFNSYISGAGIFEYTGNNINALRINDKYYNMLGTTREQYSTYSKNLIELLYPEDKKALLQMINTSLEAKGEAECTIRWKSISTPGKLVWLRIGIRLLASNGSRHVFYSTADNVTRVKELEQEVEALKAQLNNH